MKNAWQCARTSWIELKRAGNVGRYLSVLNCASENGLSFETCGRAWVFVTPRSASKRATGLDAIADPRSAWMVSCPGPMLCLAQVSAMNRSANMALSRWAHHPADGVPAEYVEHDVQVEVGPLCGTEQLGDVPTPQLVGPPGPTVPG